MPRSVLLARARPSWTAASKLVGEAAVIFDTLATAISASLVDWLPTRRPTSQYAARLAYCQHYGRCATERDRHSVRLAGSGSVVATNPALASDAHHQQA